MAIITYKCHRTENWSWSAEADIGSKTPTPSDWVIPTYSGDSVIGYDYWEPTVEGDRTYWLVWESQNRKPYTPVGPIIPPVVMDEITVIAYDSQGKRQVVQPYYYRNGTKGKIRVMPYHENGKLATRLVWGQDKVSHSRTWGEMRSNSNSQYRFI